MSEIISMLGEQSVSVQVTESGAKKAPYKLFGNTWDEKDRISAKEAIKQMEADFNVSKQPLIHIPQSVYDALLNNEPIGDIQLSRANLITTHCATVRDDLGSVLGVVGSEYSVAQNVNSLAFSDMIEEVSGHRFSITSGGLLNRGARFFLQGKLDKSCFLGGKDEIEHYITITNTHNGLGGLAIFMTPIRVICQNSLMLALKTPNKIVFKHTKHLVKRIDWEIAANRERALEVFKKSVRFTQEFEDAMLNLKSKSVTKLDTMDFAAKIFLDNEKYNLYLHNNHNWNIDEISKRTKNQLDSLIETIYNGVGQKNYYEGTALHLLNGLTCYQQNVANYRSLENQFDSMLEGTENARLNKGFKLLMSA